MRFGRIRHYHKYSRTDWAPIRSHKFFRPAKCRKVCAETRIQFKCRNINKVLFAFLSGHSLVSVGSRHFQALSTIFVVP